MISLFDSPGNIDLQLGYKISVSSNSEVEKQNSTYDFRTHVLSARIPLSQSPDFAFVTRLELGYHDIFADARLPNAPQDVPTELYDSRAQFDLLSLNEGRGTFGMTGSFGAATDKVVPSGDGFVYDGAIYYRTSLKSADGWVFAAHYSNNRNYLNGVPIPGLMYYNFRIPKLKLNLGFPVNLLIFAPSAGFKISLTSFVGKSTDLGGQVMFTDGEAAIFGVEWVQDGFLRNGRTLTEQRLFIEDKRAYIGLRAVLASRIVFAARGGIVFDRKVFQSDSVFEGADLGISISPAIYGSAQLGWEL